MEFLAKIFTLGYVDFSKRSNEAGRNMMAHIESSSYIKNNDGSEIMNFVMNNPEGERADSSKVEIEITLSHYHYYGDSSRTYSHYISTT